MEMAANAAFRKPIVMGMPNSVICGNGIVPIRKTSVERVSNGVMRWHGLGMPAAIARRGILHSVIQMSVKSGFVSITCMLMHLHDAQQHKCLQHALLTNKLGNCAHLLFHRHR